MKILAALFVLVGIVGVGWGMYTAFTSGDPEAATRRLAKAWLGALVAPLGALLALLGATLLFVPGFFGRS